METLLAAHEAAEGFLGAARVGPGGHVLPDLLTGNRPRVAASRLEKGSQLGTFEILEPLGIGGMGEVYRARDTRLDRFVAIKVLAPDLDEAPRGRERFEREARAISRLSHPHICTVHDIGSAQVDGKDVPFLVMELLDGETLAARLSRGPIPLEESLTCAVDIAGALAAAHRQGIVHRDLKPANVMMTRSGVKLLDFGLAQLRGTRDGGAAASDVSLTSAGMVLGTVPYMAPEQLRGEKADARTDVFAFGALLHEMLTGRRPFSADSQAGLVAAILEHDTPPVSALQPHAPASLDRIVRKCMAKDPDDRWQTASDLRGELQWTLDLVRGGRPFRSKRAARMAGAALAVLAGAIWALWPVSELMLPEPSLHQLTAFHGDEAYPTLSPDGSQVAFAWNGEKRGYLWRVSTTDPEPKRLELGRGGLRPDVARAGNRLAYARGGEDSDIWKFEAGAGPVPIASSSLLDVDAHLSPDGRRIALGSERFGGAREIWIVNIDGTGAVRLTGDPGGTGLKGSPRWSPDGRRIAYDVRGEDGRFGVYVIDAAGGSPRQLTADGVVPSWSRNGDWIYFRSTRSGTTQIWRMPPSGGHAEQVTEHGGQSAWESWDGTTLYYDRRGGLYSRPVAGGPEEQVLALGVGRNFVPSADGIYYAIEPDVQRRDPLQGYSAGCVFASSQAA